MRAHGIFVNPTQPNQKGNTMTTITANTPIPTGTMDLIRRANDALNRGRATRKEVCSALRCDNRSLNRWLADERVPSPKFVSALREFLAQN